MTGKVDHHIGGYHLTESIGTGGMGSVFKATVEVDGKLAAKGSVVAVKLLHPHLRAVQEFIKRFHREAALAARINHPNVVRVLDEGIYQDRHHYLVMEYAEGIKLTDLMKDGQPLSPQQTIEIMNQVCEALNAAANIRDEQDSGRVRSLVHRDIKPDNIIVQPLDRKQYETMTQTGDKTAMASIRVKLLDFGLAKDVRALSTVLSQTGQSLGTPAYMSPEQCSGASVDQRSDIYSLGVCAYQMITGTQPFPGPTTVAYAKQHAEETPPDILKRNPLCPKNLANCIYRCMAKQAKDRYQTPRELQQDLSRVAQGKSVAKVYRFKKSRAISGKKVAMIVALSVAAVLLAVAGGWFYLTDRVKTDLAQAIREADRSVVRGDYAGAKKKLEAAIAAVPNRPDKESLVAPAYRKLTEIAAKEGEEERERARAEAERLEQQRRDTEAQRKKEHEQAAVKAVAEVKALIASKEYDKAKAAAAKAINEYADTPSAKEFSELLADATAKLKAQQEAAAVMMEEQRRLKAEEDRQKRLAEEANLRARHERFVKYRDDGNEAFKNKNYQGAVLAYQNALNEEDNPAVRKLLNEATDKITRHRIAVADFKVIGDVGIPQAGQSVAELLLPKFGDRFQVVERTQLEAILKEVDLTMAQVVENPALLRGKKISGVRYLVIGSVNKLGNLAISARLVDIVTNPGDHIQTAEVSAEDARGLQNVLGELAKILQMTPDEKRAYLDERLYPELLAQARSRAAELKYDEAIGLYQRAMAIRPSGEVEVELKKVESDKVDSLKKQEDNRRREAAYTERMAAAKLVVGGMPSGKGGLTAAHKADLEKALKAVDEALTYKPGDSDALVLKEKIHAYLKTAEELKVLLKSGENVLNIELSSSVRMELVLIPAGTFLMGSKELECEKPHRVRITKSFYMCKYEVTQAQWKVVMRNNPSHFALSDTHPVESMSWDDCQEFCRRLSQNANQVIRLPTEAEWEYACRAGGGGTYCFGNSESHLEEYAWFKKNSGDTTHPVGGKKPNGFGLYDMHGNVFEWCQDWFDEDYYRKSPAADPAGPSSGSYRVDRGGCFVEESDGCRSAFRHRMPPNACMKQIGFRVVVDSAPKRTTWLPRRTEPSRTAPPARSESSSAPLPERTELLRTPGRSVPRGTDAAEDRNRGTP